MLREKIIDVLNNWLAKDLPQSEVADAIVSAIGEGQEEIAARLHYPKCWDTACYPSLHDALVEVAAGCGCSECRASSNVAPVQQEPVTADARQAVMDAVASALGDAYDCLRVWEAWGVGTMSEDDFVLVSEQYERLAEIADAAIAAITPQPAPDVAEMQARIAELERAVALAMPVIDAHAGPSRRDLFYEALATVQKRCPHCDGTGDVHRADGEWLGECNCGAAAQQPEGGDK